MTQHDREATRRIVTDAEADALSYEDWFNRDDYGDVVRALLDTREELMEALEWLRDNPVAWALAPNETLAYVNSVLSRLRGEA